MNCKSIYLVNEVEKLDSFNLFPVFGSVRNM